MPLSSAAQIEGNESYPGQKHRIELESGSAALPSHCVTRLYGTEPSGLAVGADDQNVTQVKLLEQLTKQQHGA